MTTDEQEARSIKYSADVWSFAYLESGNWALYNHGRQLYGIYKGYREMMIAYKDRPAPSFVEAVKKVDGEAFDLSLEELGL